ncbi:hypothetical protein IEO21_10293 [Rhodonia placenta]|uniref:Integrase catalytic domain-containing protein n=1 Tax=Rhodonia placenta TaxID=104341 RepID=A0A8H7TXK2_9APHY|nr:hypothetical protein IEO21_10293 [Postia placenta]
MGEFESARADRISKRSAAARNASAEVRVFNINVVGGGYAAWSVATWGMEDAKADEVASSMLCTLLRMEDDVLYIGNEFQSERKQGMELEKAWERERNAVQSSFVRRGDMMVYARAVSSRYLYEDLPAPASLRDMRCVTHEGRVRDRDDPAMFEEIRKYLQEGELPERCTNDSRVRGTFVRLARSFILNDRHLWWVSKGELPKLVVLDVERRREIIAEAHNDCGHCGRDPTFRKVADRFWWPNQYDEIAFFVRSCNTCQYRAKSRLLQPLSITISPSILRRFVLDTIHMPQGSNGHRYLLHASDDVSRWPEAVSSRKNNAETWAKFIWKVLCWFGCIPVFVCDGGPEFKGAARTILLRHGVSVILSSPYHPEGNGIAERDGQTLMRAVMQSCGKRTKDWPLFLEAGLLAVRTTTSRATGTWSVLEWDKVRTTEDLLTMRLQQIACKDELVEEAVKHLIKSRRRSADDYNKKHARSMTEAFEPGMWVLVHETWLDNQHGNKGALRWAGPYVIQERHTSGSYAIQELDGVVLKEAVATSRLKLFYYRNDHQVMM